METCDCILCGKPGAAWFVKADKFPPHELFHVVRCPECGMAWVSPRPAPDEIGRYYPPTYSWKPDAAGEESLIHRAERWYRFHLLRYETRQFLAYTDVARGDAVLDVGCSSGDRLLVMKEAGLAPAGVEISPAADFARERLKLEVRRGTLEESHFEAGRFRAVTLHNVLEHVHDPRRLLEETHRILAPGGWLVVQSPNKASHQARLFGKRWAAVDIPRELYYYTPAILGRMFEAGGFEVVHVVHQTSFLHPPTAAISLVPWADPQRFWKAEAEGGAAVGLARRLAWAVATVAVMPAVWLESRLGAGAIPTTFARKPVSSGRS